MLLGKCKFFNKEKGFGFLIRDDNLPDVFCHISDLKQSGLGELKTDQRIQFEVVPGREGKGLKAVNLKVLA